MKIGIHEAKNMGEVVALILKVKSRADGKRFVMDYLESAPGLTEAQIIENIEFGLSRHFDGSAGSTREYKRYMAYFRDE